MSFLENVVRTTCSVSTYSLLSETPPLHMAFRGGKNYGVWKSSHFTMSFTLLWRSIGSPNDNPRTAVSFSPNIVRRNETSGLESLIIRLLGQIIYAIPDASKHYLVLSTNYYYCMQAAHNPERAKASAGATGYSGADALYFTYLGQLVVRCVWTRLPSFFSEN